MEHHKSLLSTLIVLFLVFLLAYFFPWKNINWGTIKMSPAETVTVSGYADSQEGNQQASFTAGISSVNDDKQTAVDEANKIQSDIVAKVKAFGIADADIKTQAMSIYQNQDSVMQDGLSRLKPGQWSVSNTVEITLKDITKANDLANLLASTGANNVYGPNFTTGDSRVAQKALMSAAIADAKGKAEEAAKASGKQLGEILSVTEGGANSAYPMPMYDRAMGMGGGGAGLEPGSSTVTQSVVVTFELK
jgi:uncharacterized protein YggE